MINFEEAKKACCIGSTKGRKKIFHTDEIKAIHLMIDDKIFSIKSSAKFFHTDYRRITEIKKILIENNPVTKKDYIDITNKINET